ncbi:MAG: hypothetical protein CMLOHMNK_00976 [Steroidobacteraceae bacterium]|nr:hypothetical protein [Steroidobacteraceae bacterium]
MAEPFDAVSELARTLYAGVIETPPWQGFLREIRRHTDSKTTLVMLSPPGSAAVSLISVIGGQPEVNIAYRDQLFALDPFVHLPEGRVTTLHEFVGAAALERNDYYRQFMCTRWGVGYVLGTDVRTAAGFTACLRLCRGVESRNFEADTYRLVETLVPHLRQAIEIFDRLHGLRVEEIEFHDALDQLAVASFLLDSQLRVVQPNSCAASLLAAGEGMMVRNGRLVLSDGNAQQQLKAILERARVASGPPEGGPTCLPEVIVIARKTGAPPLALAVRPLRSPAELRADHVPVVAVYASAGGPQGMVPPATVRQLLGVTPAEAELATRLAGGATIDEAARDLRISRATARTQLYSIFRKAGVRRQSELIALIAQTAARLTQR